MPFPLGDRTRDAILDAVALVFPIDCAGCGAPDRALCASCRGRLVPTVSMRTLPGDLRVWSGLVYAGVAADALRALKEDGRTGVISALAPALAAAATGALGDADRGSEIGGGGVARAPAGSELACAASDLVFVGVPSSRAAMRRRGFRPVEMLARRAGVPLVPLLRITRVVADQRSLGVAGRAGNVIGSLLSRDATGLRVIVVDDVVTTGATLVEAARALRVGGATVLGAAVVASTPRRNDAFATHR